MYAWGGQIAEDIMGYPPSGSWSHDLRLVRKMHLYAKDLSEKEFIAATKGTAERILRDNRPLLEAATQRMTDNLVITYSEFFGHT